MNVEAPAICGLDTVTVPAACAPVVRGLGIITVLYLLHVKTGRQ